LKKHVTVALVVTASAFLVLATGAMAASGQGDPTRAATKSGSSAKQAFPRSYKLADDRTSHWAVIMSRVAAHAQPWQASPVKTMLDIATPEGTQNLVLILEGKDVTPAKTWYRVRLPILPNNSTGWVPATSLGELNKVNTHLYVNRANLTATLKRNGKTVFKSIVGVGHSYWPTPAGEYYIRDRLSGFDNPVYGPIAFGTSARSPTLTDWPGGGFVGVHGTNDPGILPGQVSHGCIRMTNESIVKLARLMPVGTPLTVS